MFEVLPGWLSCGLRALKPSPSIIRCISQSVTSVVGVTIRTGLCQSLYVSTTYCSAFQFVGSAFPVDRLLSSELVMDKCFLVSTECVMLAMVQEEEWYPKPSIPDEDLHHDEVQHSAETRNIFSFIAEQQGSWYQAPTEWCLVDQACSASSAGNQQLRVGQSPPVGLAGGEGGCHTARRYVEHSSFASAVHAPADLHCCRPTPYHGV